jgi:hypothetical protein
MKVMKINLNHQYGLILCICFGIFTYTLCAQTNKSLFDIPTAENVLKNIKGNNNIDTYAKQYAALNVLFDVANRYLHKDNKTNQIILEQRKEYESTMGLLRNKYIEETNKLDDWDNIWKAYYYRTPGFKEEIIETLLSPKAKEYYDAEGRRKAGISTTIIDNIKNEQALRDAEIAQKEEESVNKIIRQVILIIGLMIGIFILLKARSWNNKLRQYEFDNITDGGVVQFTDFKEAENHRKNKVYAGYLWFLGCIITIFVVIALLLQ